MTEIYWEFYISFAAASLSDVVKNPLHNGAKSIMKSYLYIYYSYIHPTVSRIIFVTFGLCIKSGFEKVLKNYSVKLQIIIIQTQLRKLVGPIAQWFYSFRWFLKGIETHHYLHWEMYDFKFSNILNQFKTFCPIRKSC